MFQKIINSSDFTSRYLAQRDVSGWIDSFIETLSFIQAQKDQPQNKWHLEGTIQAHTILAAYNGISIAAFFDDRSIGRNQIKNGAMDLYIRSILRKIPRDIRRDISEDFQSHIDALPKSWLFPLLGVVHDYKKMECRTTHTDKITGETKMYEFRGKPALDYKFTDHESRGEKDYDKDLAPLLPLSSPQHTIIKVAIGNHKDFTDIVKSVANMRGPSADKLTQGLTALAIRWKTFKPADIFYLCALFGLADNLAKCGGVATGKLTYPKYNDEILAGFQELIRIGAQMP